ncbi:MAG: hypothetical protein JNK82_31810 [Myxococcaceae bacterium]|nr:hypothetical protein [Myxococcaceae bacterium]
MVALLLVVLAQAPSDVPVAIVVSSRRDTGNQAPAAAEQLKAALAAQGITATSDAESVKRITALGGVDPKACDAARLCLQKLAQLLQGVVIGVDVSKAGKLTAAHIEAVSYDRVESLAADDLTSDAKSWARKSAAAAAAFAQKLQAPVAALNEARRAKVVEAPLPPAPGLERPREVRVVPEPPPVPPPAVAAEPLPPPQKSALGPVGYVTGAVAIIAIGAGIACLILGFLDRGTYFQTQSSTGALPGIASTYNDQQLAGLAAQSNLRIGLGGGLVGLGALLGITSALLFAKE